MPWAEETWTPVFHLLLGSQRWVETGCKLCPSWHCFFWRETGEVSVSATRVKRPLKHFEWMRTKQSNICWGWRRNECSLGCTRIAQVHPRHSKRTKLSLAISARGRTGATAVGQRDGQQGRAWRRSAKEVVVVGIQFLLEPNQWRVDSWTSRGMSGRQAEPLAGTHRDRCEGERQIRVVGMEMAAESVLAAEGGPRNDLCGPAGRRMRN